MTGLQLHNYDLDVQVVMDESGKIAQGLVLADTLPQNQALILELRKGELKDDVSVGVGIADMLLDGDVQAWRSEIREQMEMDGQTVNSVTVTTDKITIDASY